MVGYSTHSASVIPKGTLLLGLCIPPSQKNYKMCVDTSSVSKKNIFNTFPFLPSKRRTNYVFRGVKNGEKKTFKKNTKKNLAQMV